MQVHFDYHNFPKVHCPIVTTGTFDGVHIGHQTIIQRLTELAKKYNGESVVLTFEPHPRIVLDTKNQIEILNTLNEKINSLEALGVDHLVVIPFNHEFAAMSSASYINDILVNCIGVKRLVIGYDHHFGKNREGSFQSLEKSAATYGFELEEISARDIDEVVVSSTKIRKALLEGDIETANMYLGRPYELSGIVVHGEKKGRLLGFPTANIEVNSPHKLIPANGVYAVKVNHQGTAQFANGMLNIGIRPTVSQSASRTIEVHLIDQNLDLYGQSLQIFFFHKIRDEQKFATIETLIAQIKKDEEQVKGLFSC